MRPLTLTLRVIVSALVKAVSCNVRTRAQTVQGAVAATTPPPSMRGIDWRRQVQGETCGFQPTAGASLVTCDEGATCATSRATTEGLSSTQTALYIGCCKRDGVCDSFFTSCADSSDVPQQTTVDLNVLTCSDPGSPLCRTYSWIDNGALAFGCRTTGGLVPLVTSKPTASSSSRTATPSDSGVPTQSTTPQGTSPSAGGGYSAGMSLGAKIGVGVGCGTVGLIASGIAIFFLRTPRRKTVVSQPGSSPGRDAGSQEKVAASEARTTLLGGANTES